MNLQSTSFVPSVFQRSVTILLVATATSILHPSVNGALTSCAHHYLIGEHKSGIYGLQMGSQIAYLRCDMPNITETDNIVTVVRNAMDSKLITFDSIRKRKDMGIQHQLKPSQLNILWSSLNCSQTMKIDCFQRSSEEELFKIEYANAEFDVIYGTKCTIGDGVIQLKQSPVNILPNPESSLSFSLSMSDLRCEDKLNHMSPDCVFQMREGTNPLVLNAPSDAPVRRIRVSFRTYEWNLPQFLTLRTASTGEGDLPLSLRDGYFVMVEPSGAQKQPYKVSPNGFLSDGRWHTIELKLEHKSVIIDVDNNPVAFRAHDDLIQPQLHSFVIKSNNRAHFDVASVWMDEQVHCGSRSRYQSMGSSLCQNGGVCRSCTAPLDVSLSVTQRADVCPDPMHDDNVGFNFDGSTTGHNMLRLRLTNQHRPFETDFSITFRTAAKSALLMWAYKPKPASNKFEILQLYLNDTHHVHAALCGKPGPKVQCQTCSLRVTQGFNQMSWHVVSVFVRDNAYWLATDGMLCELRPKLRRNILPDQYNLYDHVIYERVLQAATFVGGVPLAKGLYKDDSWGTVRDSPLPPLAGCVRSVLVDGKRMDLPGAISTTNDMFSDELTTKHTVSVREGCVTCQCASRVQCLPNWRSRTSICDCARSLLMARSNVCLLPPTHSLAMSTQSAPVFTTITKQQLNYVSATSSQIRRLWLSFQMPASESLRMLAVTPWIQIRDVFGRDVLIISLSSDHQVRIQSNGALLELPLYPLTTRRHFLIIDNYPDSGLEHRQSVTLDNTTRTFDSEVLSGFGVAMLHNISIRAYYTDQDTPSANQGYITEFLLDQYSSANTIDLLRSFKVVDNKGSNNNSAGNCCGIRDLSVLEAQPLATAFGRLTDYIPIQLLPDDQGYLPKNGVDQNLGIWLIIAVVVAALIFAIVLTVLCLMMRKTTRRKAAYHSTPHRVREDDQNSTTKDIQDIDLSLPRTHDTVDSLNNHSNNQVHQLPPQRYQQNGKPYERNITWVDDVNRTKSVIV